MNQLTFLDNNHDVFIESTETLPSLSVLVDHFLLIKDISPQSRNLYAGIFKLFQKYLDSIGATHVKEHHIKDYKDDLKSKNLSNHTIISHMTALKSLFTFLSKRGLYPNVCTEVKTPKKANSFTRDTLSKKQASALSRVASGDDIRSRRDKAILNVLLRCGLRSIELIRANVGDIRETNTTGVLWVHGKGRDAKDEYVVLTHEASKVIRDYLTLRTNVKHEDPLFVSHGRSRKNERLTTRSIRRMVKERLRDIDIDDPRITCHSLRHTFATLALANNAPILAIQKAMRHANINSTTIYTHMLDRLNNGAEHFIDI